jgi:hypothetical protein
VLLLGVLEVRMNLDGNLNSSCHTRPTPMTSQIAYRYSAVGLDPLLMTRVILGNTPTTGIVTVIATLLKLLVITQFFGFPFGLLSQCGIKTRALSIPLCTQASDKEMMN